MSKSSEVELSGTSSFSRASEDSSSEVVDIEVMRKLGEGVYSKVYLANHGGNLIALKALNKNKTSREEFLAEYNILKAFNHDNVVKAFDIFDDEDAYYITMEYVAGGPMLNYVQQRKRLNEPQARVMFRKLCSAFEHIHQQGYLHRDVKLENILVETDGNPKVTDFGFGGPWSVNEVQKRFCGSFPYCSPEMCLGRPYIGPEVDIWSLGVLLFALVTGKLPFKGGSEDEVTDKIVNAVLNFPDFISDDVRDLITKILDPDPNSRYLMPDIMAHRWMKSTTTPTELGVTQHSLRLSQGSLTVPGQQPGVKPGETTAGSTANLATERKSMRLSLSNLLKKLNLKKTAGERTPPKNSPRSKKSAGKDDVTDGSGSSTSSATTGEPSAAAAGGGSAVATAANDAAVELRQPSSNARQRPRSYTQGSGMSRRQAGQNVSAADLMHFAGIDNSDPTATRGGAAAAAAAGDGGGAAAGGSGSKPRIAPAGMSKKQNTFNSGLDKFLAKPKPKAQQQDQGDISITVPVGLSVSQGGGTGQRRRSATPPPSRSRREPDLTQTMG